ncbi:zinc finger, SWIM-type containing protein [Tanacetum coccineum]
MSGHPSRRDLRTCTWVNSIYPVFGLYCGGGGKEEVYRICLSRGAGSLILKLCDRDVSCSSAPRYPAIKKLEKEPALFSLKLHHAEKFKELEKRKYVNGLVAYVHRFDIDKFYVHELNDVMVELGYVNDDPIYYHYMIPGIDLEIGLRALCNDLDVLGLANSVVIKELPSSSMIPKKGLLLKYHKPSTTPHVTPSPTTTVNPTPTSNNTTIVTPSPIPTYNLSPIVTPSHSPNATPSPSKSKFTKSSANRRKTNVNDIEHVPLLANVNVQDHEPLPANANTNENETILNDQPSVNEQERARDDNNEPEETLVEGEKVDEDEEDNSTEEGDSDLEDDDDYFVDEDTYLEEVNVDMADYHFNIDVEVEWVRHSNSRQEQDRDPIPGELDVIDNDNFESGTNSEDDGIVKIRRQKLREIKKANESDDNIKEAVLAKNDKFRIKAKCLGRIHVFTLDGEGPSNTEEVAPTKKTTKVKGKKDVGPSDAVEPNKKGSGEIHACTSKCLSKGIVDQMEKNPDIPIKALATKERFIGLWQSLLGLDGAFMKGPYPGQLLTAVGLDGNNGIYPLAYAILEKETTCSWTWFLECLGDDLGMTKESNFTFISDR